MKVIVGNNVKRDLWEDLLNHSQYSSPFQTAEFYDFFKEVPGFDAEVFAIGSDALSILCVVTFQAEKGIKGFFSRRAIIYGGPILLSDTSLGEIDTLLLEIEYFCKRRAIYIEFRNYFNYEYVADTFKARGFRLVPWLNFQLKTEDISVVKASMSSSRLRQIKKAVKQGVEWRVATCESDIHEFYTILQKLYLEKVRKPLFPVEFFLTFFNKEVGKYLLVYYEDKIIGGIMCPIFKNKGIYEYYVCGLDAEFKEQYPSVMATWAAIEYAVQNRIPMFDFMGAGNPSDDYGVREFKTRFGGHLVQHGRFHKILNPLLYIIGKFGLTLLSKIKK